MRARLLALAVLLLVDPTSASSWWPAASSRPSLSIAQSAQQFSDCQIKSKWGADDVDLDRFVKATAAYCELIRAWGYFTSPSISQVYSCLAKLEMAREMYGNSGTAPRRRYGLRRGKKSSSMKALLEAERAAGIHKPGAVLADPSGICRPFLSCNGKW